MSNISFTAITDGSTIDASDVNGPLNTIYDDYNGNIDSNNLADNAVTTAKITDANITAAKFGIGAVTGADGWVSTSDTWVYVSASSFKISGVDRTTTYTKGTRLKFTQTTVKYAVVVSSAFSTDTTVTIAVNTDYTIANAAITNNYYSYAANPQGYPGKFAFTTTVTAPSGTVPTYSTNSGYFSIVGTHINCSAILANSSGGTAGSGAVVLYISKPVAAQTSSVNGIFKMYENGGSIYAGVVSDNDATTCYLTKYDMVANVLAQDQSSADRYIHLNYNYMF